MSSIGNLVDSELGKINEIYENVKVDNYVIMPNHLHIILRIDSSNVDGNSGNGNGGGSVADNDNGGGNRDGGRPKAAPTVSTIMNKFKGSISKQLGYSIWQKLFHDHVIRSEAEYQRIWQYIEKNPQNWQEDCHHTK